MSISRKFSITIAAVACFVAILFFATETKTVFAQEICDIESARFEPSGNQGNDWLQANPDQRTMLRIVVKTKNCSGKSILVSMKEVSGRTPRTILDLNKKKYFIGEDEKLELTLKAGDKACKNKACEYTLSASGQKTATEPSEANGGVLKFGCAKKVVGGVFVECALSTELTGTYPPQDRRGLSDDKNGSYSPADDITYGDSFELLAPLPYLEDVDENTTIGEYVNVVVQLLIGIASLLAFIMIVVGGVQYMTTDAITGKKKARGNIQNAILGLLLALGSYLILFTINPDLVRVEPRIESFPFHYDEVPVFQESTGKFLDPKTGKPIQVDGEDLIAGDPWKDKLLAKEKYASIEGRLKEIGIVPNKTGDCDTVWQDKGCTSLIFEKAVGDKIVETLKIIKEKSKASKIVISGGSEQWLHLTHGPSKAIVDISVRNTPPADLSRLNKYLTGEEKYLGNCKPQNIRKDGFNITVTDEHPTGCGKAGLIEHWHVVIN